MKTVAETGRQRWQRDTLEPTLEKSPERAQTFSTISGRPIERLYTAEDVTRQEPLPGEFPYTRGIHPTGYRGRLWTMRQFAGFGTPEETSVPRVRVKRATATFRISVPNTGSLSTRASMSDLPPSVL